MNRQPVAPQADDGSSYANRIPHRQSLYDWAPGSDDEELYRELLSRANIPTFAQSALPPSRHLNLEPHERPHSRSRVPAPGDATPRGNPGAERTSPAGSSHRIDPAAGPTRAGIIQAVEQHRRLNARVISTLHRYLVVLERQVDDPDPGLTSWARSHGSEEQSPGSPYEVTRSRSEQSDLQDAYHEIFLQNPSLARLKNSIRYLSKLRQCASLEEGLQLATELAIDSSCLRGQRAGPHRFTKLSNLIVETSSLSAVAECSWLTPGTVFTGSQHTPAGPATVIPNRQRERHRSQHVQSRLERIRQERSLEQALHDRHRRMSYTPNAPSRHRPPGPETSSQGGASDGHATSTRSNPTNDPPVQPDEPSLGVQSDHWPVAVTLHDVSLVDLTLSGTMSATHIPDKLSTQSPLHNPQGSSMQSFFEGEIIDFKKNTLETENFDTGEDEDGLGIGRLGTDARYWRGLGPFRELLESAKAKKRSGKTRADASKGEDDEDVVEDAQGGEDIIASHLRSRSWIDEVLLKEWVLMRWKEKCFIKGTDSDELGSRGATAITTNNNSSSSSSTAPTDPASWGLTISGFYYVTLRRQTGEMDGLYYDPGSLPFQVLGLRPEGQEVGGGGRGGGGATRMTMGVKRQWPAQQFR